MKGLSLKRTAAIFMTSALLFTNNILSVAALDSKDVSYQGVTGKVEVASQNLFEGMEGLLPGDIVGRAINFKNNSNSDVTFYLMAEPAADYASENEAVISKELISLLKLKLELTSPAGVTSVIYSGALSGNPQDAGDTVGSMILPVTLGKLSAQQSGVLRATITVPNELGNRYQNAVGRINWSFYCDVASDSGGGDSGGGDSGGGTSGGGTSGGGTSGGGTSPQIDIKDPDVPLIDNGIDIADPQVPLSGITGKSAKDIKDQPVPLSGVLIVVDDKTLGNLPKTGSVQTSSKAIVFSAIVVVAGSLCAVAFKKRKSK